MNNRELIIGLDLTDDYSQLSYALSLDDEAESISIKEEEKQYLIPTIVGLLKDKKQWVYGEEALELSKEGKAEVATNLLENIKNSNKTNLYGSAYDPIYIMERYMYKLLMELKRIWSGKTIRQMVITINNLDQLVVDGLYKALENLELLKDRVQIQSHEHSYLSYILSQEKNIWMNDVALFDFNKEDFIYSQITIERRKTPYLVVSRSKKYNDSITYDELEKITSEGNFEYILENVINDALFMQIISAIYFTGKGFKDGIPMNTLKKISKGRRIFIGQNLYCKGACYWASRLAGSGKLGNFVFLLDSTLHYSVGIGLYDDGAYKDVLLGKLGDSIYEQPKTVDLILDDESKVKYKVKDKGGFVVLEDKIELDDMPKRPNKTTRIQVSLHLINRNRFKIQIKDMGFGEMYPATDKMWEKEVLING